MQITMHIYSQRMRRLLASDLLPRRAGQPVKALLRHEAQCCIACLAGRDGRRYLWI